MAWSAMPDFVNGTMVSEADLDPIVANVTNLRNSSRIIAGKVAVTPGALVSGIAGTETNIPNLAITGLQVENNQWYTMNLTMYGQFTGTMANQSYLLRVRQGTPVTGTQIGIAPWLPLYTLLDDYRTFVLPWKATTSGTVSLYVSAQKAQAAITTSLTVYGSGNTAFWIEKMGDDPSVWVAT